MTDFTESKAISFCKMICALAVGFFILISSCTVAHAYEENFVGNSKYWKDKGEIVNISNDKFNGCLRYYVDENDGCVYFYFNFYDLLLTEKNNGVYLSFKVRNSENSYLITLGKSGINNDNKFEIEENFNVYYDFSRVDPKYHGGEAFVALEFKNSDDKKLNNKVSCEYSCTKSNNFVIIEDVSVNMLKATTAKTTKETTQKTTKAATEKATTSKATTQKTINKINSTTIKNGNTSRSKKNTTEKSTKFVPSTTSKKFSAKNTKSNAKSNSYTSKFSANTTYSQANASGLEQNYYQVDNNQTIYPTDFQKSGTVRAVTSRNSNSLLGNRTPESTILFAFAIAVFVIGVVVIFYGAVGGKYKIVKTDDISESSDENE